MIRLVATDLDGTLLRSDGTVSPRTRAALEAAEAAGLVVVFVTGRPPRWLDHVVEETGHLGVAVGANGAVIYDLHDEQIVRAHTLEPAVALEVAEDVRARFPGVSYAVEYVDGFAAEADYVHDWTINPDNDRRGNPLPMPRVAPLAQIVDRPLLKLLAKDKGREADEFLALAGTLLGDRATITHSSSIGLLEIAAPGVTKATGLAEVAADHDIAASEVVAIGDMPNDIPMLEWAGRSCAVANAHPTVRAVADEVVGTNDEDAVAVLIESVLADR